MVQWRGRRRSKNVEDIRGRPSSRPAGLGGFKLKGGIGTIVLIAVVYFMGGDLSQILGLLMQGGQGSPVSQSAPARPAGPVGNDDGAQFVSVILADTEATWGQIFQQSGQRYPEPKLTLFNDAVNSACGYNSAAVGPFYCPPDQKVYLDLSFFAQLKQLGAPGDFAQAYVIGHEIGHHVQNVIGILPAVQQKKQTLSQVEANQLQVLVELQADCFAGVWAHHAESQRDLLESGDIKEGMTAAASIGDDALQRRAGRSVRPESFTHGASSERVAWFKRGADTGRVDACDTFKQAGVQLSAVSLRTTTPASNKRVSFNQTSRNTVAHTADQAFAAQRSDVQVQGRGRVTKVLPDDNNGSRHQRFILRVAADQTMLVAHNIDLAQRLPGLKTGDEVAFYGEYEWNNKGGVLHWTHHDPAGRHPDGWLKYNGRTYH
jgi:uncharacterized protein